VRAFVLDDAEAAVRGAHIVITATDSATPVFAGAWVDPGTHVTGIGSYTPRMREVDTTLVRRARVFVDQRAAALAEAGDLAGPIADGDVDADVVVAEIGEVAAGTRAGRTSDDDVTFFKSVGNAIQDVAVAARVLAVAEREGRGVLVDL
jgi:ornithine cyclodeaminase